MDRLTRQFVPPAVEISLSRLAALVPGKESIFVVQLGKDPPAILASYKPSSWMETATSKRSERCTFLIVNFS